MNNAEAIFFYILSFLALFSAAKAVFSAKNIAVIIYCFICFICVAGLFFALELPFLGFVQIITMAVSFIILMFTLNILTDKNYIYQKETNHLAKFLIPVFAISFITFTISIFIRFSNFTQEGTDIYCVMPSTKDIAVEFFINYGVPIVFSGLCILLTVIGISILFFDVRNKKGAKK